jgi:hypothetical protein
MPRTESPLPGKPEDKMAATKDVTKLMEFGLAKKEATRMSKEIREAGGTVDEWLEAMSDDSEINTEIGSLMSHGNLSYDVAVNKRKEILDAGSSVKEYLADALAFELKFNETNLSRGAKRLVNLAKRVAEAQGGEVRDLIIKAVDEALA